MSHSPDGNDIPLTTVSGYSGQRERFDKKTQTFASKKLKIR